MIGSPEIPTFDVSAFDSSFFVGYEAQLSDIHVADQASQALAEILTIERVDGTQKTYRQIQADTQTFFASDRVRTDEAIMNRLAMEFAQACMGHRHGAELAQDNQLGSVFARGVQNLGGDTHDLQHDHHTQDKDDEVDPKTGKKKKKRTAWIGWFAVTK